MTSRAFTSEEVVVIAESAGVHLPQGERADAIAAIDATFRGMFDAIDDFPESLLLLSAPPVAGYGETS